MSQSQLPAFEYVFVDVATVLLTSEQSAWLNSQVERGKYADRGAALRTLINAEILREYK